MKSKTKVMLMSMGAMALVAMLGGQAHAVMADTIVGSYDSGNSGDAGELLALETACLCDLTLLTKVEDSAVIVQTDGIVNYVDVSPDAPGYFVLKFGNGNDPIDTFVFQNLNELNLLAWTDAQLISYGLDAGHVQSISHYAYAGGGTVPEPASLLLLGAGLAGLGIWRRKQA